MRRLLKRFLPLIEAVVVMVLVCAAAVESGNEWPLLTGFVLGAVGVLALVTVAVVAVLVYSRLHGVSLAHLATEMKLQREQRQQRVKRLPDGMA